jgi:uncharacterized protein YkwD
MSGMARILLTGLLLLAVAPPVWAGEKQRGTCPDRYNLESKFLANPDESLLIAGLIGWCRNNKYRLLWDERYAAAAREWSGFLAEGQVPTDRFLRQDRLRFELVSRGVTDAAFLPFSVETEADKMPSELLDFLTQNAKRGRFSHFAVGVTRTPGQKRMVSTLVLGRRPALIDPIPVCPAPADRLELKVRLRRDYNHPVWLMTLPDGNVAKKAFEYEEGAWHSQVALDAGSGTYQMEVVVLGPQGPEVAALFPLYVGKEKPRIPEVKLRPAPVRYRTPEDAEKALVKMINQARTRQGLAPLTAEEGLSAVAREHSMELLAARHAVHRTRGTGTLLDRLRKSGVKFARALENVSLSPSPEAAHERFMGSPGHRINILDPYATRLGLGIAMERGSNEDILAVCQVFVEPLQSTDISQVARRVLDLINHHRKKRGRFALGEDQELSRVALRSVRRLSDLGNKADAQAESERLAENLSESDMPMTGFQVRYFKTTNLRRVLTLKQVLDEDFNRLGIGVASTRNKSLKDEVWIGLIFAGR